MRVVMWLGVTVLAAIVVGLAVSIYREISRPDDYRGRW
jgi:hypothetical protein